MSCDIYETWDELNCFLLALSSHYASVLRPPTDEDKVCHFEDSLNLKIPRDYRDFLMIHDGCNTGDDNEFIVFAFYGIAELAMHTSRLREQQRADSRHRSFEQGGWDDQKLLIGTTSAGWDLVLDCCKGVPYVFAKSNYALPLADSFLGYLAGLKENLRDNRFTMIESRIFMDEWGQRY